MKSTTTRNWSTTLVICGIFLLVTLALPAYSVNGETEAKVSYFRFIAWDFGANSPTGIQAAASLAYLATLLCALWLGIGGVFAGINPGSALVAKLFSTPAAAIGSILLGIGGVLGFCALGELKADVGLVVYALMAIYSIITIWQSRRMMKAAAGEISSEQSAPQSADKK